MARFLGTFTVALVFFTSTSNVSADTQFRVAYENHYTVGHNGSTIVQQTITLTNLTNRYYASEYRLVVRDRKIENIKARDNQGKLVSTVSQKDGGSEIHVIFNEKIVGSGKTLRWVLEYELPDAARKNGLIWEVTIPGITQSEEITRYHVTLAVPKEFGSPSFISPQPSAEQSTDKKTEFTFDQGIVAKSGVSAVFGHVQRYALSLTYHLANPNLVPVFEEIALPPNTSYQDVYYSSITPRPLDVRVDQDGNYLAKYELTRGQKLDVEVTGLVEMARKKQTVVPLSESDRKRYLEPQRYWEVTSPLIGEKASELKNARAIYQFVTQYLSYDQQRLNESRIERFGAVTALSRPNNAVCMEYTDLFVALARAAGIPAREINGYAYTADTTFRPLSLKNNADILHAWPEYYDDTLGWVPVDPTWGSTTGGVNYFDQLDLNHITFAIHGFSSTQPYPAGAYKYDPNQGPDVSIAFTQSAVAPSSTISLHLAIGKTLISGIETRGKVIVRNLGNIATTAGTLSLEPENLTVVGPTHVLVGTLPAFANREIEFLVKGGALFQTVHGLLRAQLETQADEVALTLAPLPLFQTVPWIGGIIGGTAIIYIGYILAAWYRRRRLNAVPRLSPPQETKAPPTVKA